MLRDAAHAARLIIRYPSFSILIIATAGLGIGAATAMFSAVDALILRPLPYKGAERLASVFASVPEWRADPGASRFWNQITVSYSDYEAWRQRQATFEDSAVFNNRAMSFMINGDIDNLRVGSAEARLFSMLGVQPVLGRLFTDASAPETHAPVLVSYRMWQQEYSANPNVLGLQIHGIAPQRLYTIVGVLPREFELPGFGTDAGPVPDLWLPISSAGGEVSERPSFEIIGRLKEGVSVEAAEQEASRIFQQLPLSIGPPNLKTGGHVVSIGEQQTRPVRGIFILFDAACVLLLIACVNIATLLLGRSVQRQHEISVRAALGASRMQILQQLMIEGIMLAAIGAIAGGVLGSWAMRALVTHFPERLPRADNIGLDGRVLLFMAGAAVITGVLFGLAPALTLIRTDVQIGLNQTRRAGIFARHTLQRSLIIAEICASFVLLIAAGLLIASLVRLNRAAPGFDSAKLIDAEIRLPSSRYSDSVQTSIFYDNVLGRLRSLQGIDQVTAITAAPFSGGQYAARIRAEHNGVIPDQPGPHVEWRGALPNYFDAAGIPLIEGRAFTTADDIRNVRDRQYDFVIVNKAFAEQFWPGEDPLNKRFRVESAPWLSVVIGVVDNAKEFRLDEESHPMLYWPFARGLPNSVSVLVRTSQPEALLPRVRQEIQGADSQLPPVQIGSMESRISATLTRARYAVFVMSLFAIAAAALAVIGVYGVISRSVAARTVEFGIRMAVGAHPSSIMLNVLAEALSLTAAGIAAGACASVLLNTLLMHLRWTANPVAATRLDVPVYIVVVAGFTAAALLASYIPARPAVRIDPALCLRSE